MPEAESKDMRVKSCHIQGILVVILLFSMASCTHIGQRLLTIQIEVDGVTVFEGIRGVPDNMPVDQMWSVLHDVPFQLADTATDADDAQTRSLEGDVVVRIRHVDQELTRARLDSLSLRKDAAGSSWTLGKSEADRIKRVKGQSR